MNQRDGFGLHAAARKNEAPRLSYRLQNTRDLVALAVMAIAYLQYYFLDVGLQISALPKIIVFVPLAVA